MRKLKKRFDKSDSPICKICGLKYSSSYEARACEKLPITQDKGAKVGDRIFILFGEHGGKILIITRIFVVRLALTHTVAVEAKLPSGELCEFLFYDYEIPPREKE